MAVDTLLPFRPRIVYGSGPTTLNLKLPLPPWEIETHIAGGSDYAEGSGIGAAIVIAHTEIAALRLQRWESERAAVALWLRWAQANMHQTFAFRFDQNDAATEYDVYLHSPSIGSGTFRPVRTQYLGALEAPIQLRLAPSAVFTVNWTGE